MNPSPRMLRRAEVCGYRGFSVAGEPDQSEALDDLPLQSDAVDFKKSKLDHFSDGSICHVITFRFIQSRLKHPIYRLKCLSPTRTWQYVTDELPAAKRQDDRGLTLLKCRLIRNVESSLAT